MYIGRTTVRQTSTDTLVETWAEFIRSWDEALARHPPSQRQNIRKNPGDYRMEYQLRCFVKVWLRGIEQQAGHLTLEYAVWFTRQDYEAGQPPALRNTHQFQLVAGFFDGMTREQKHAWFLAHIREYLIRASFRDLTGDDRLRVLRLRAPEDDPAGVMADPDLVALDGLEYEETG